MILSNPLEPHPFAALFPELPSEELTQLARNIQERRQLEPIILYKGLILDGRNRYRACQIAGVKPRTEEFNAKAEPLLQQALQIYQKALGPEHPDTALRTCLRMHGVWCWDDSLSERSDGGAVGAD